MMQKLVTVFVLSVFIISFKVSAINQLSIQDPDDENKIYDGYIEKATLVMQPHGGYVEESLYLEYSDRGAFEGRDNLEIVHRFELPTDAVVNDMWLWIGDSVMQAVLLDTWTARAIYDSVVAKKIDPAFFAKDGDQYELHIYPLKSGDYRKVKLNFIAPTKWIGNSALAPLPFRMLMSNNSTAKPLEILFRTEEQVWGEPGIYENSQYAFSYYEQAKGYLYKKTEIPDISDFSSLNLAFETQFPDGYFFKNYKNSEYGTFLLGLSPETFFELQPDSSKQDVLIGIDLSGKPYWQADELQSNIKNVLSNAIKSNDRFYVVATANSGFFRFAENFQSFQNATPNAMITELFQTEMLQSIDRSIKKVCFCDWHSSTCWGFPGIEDIAEINKYSTIVDAYPYFQNADVVAAYDHGHDKRISQEDANIVIPALDAFFENGGRFLTFYDQNRVGRELLASHYINNLNRIESADNELFHNPDGNIGAYFPDHVIVSFASSLTFDDPDVVVELADAQGRAAVISKKIGSGLLVVSGIWSFKDDAALREILAMPLLGLNESSQHQQLTELLEKMADTFQEKHYDKAIIFSNTDSLLNEEQTANWLSTFNLLSGHDKPVINTVNLLDGIDYTPGSVEIDNEKYYGSGYLLHQLAAQTGGLSFETYQDDWPYISGALDAFALPAREAFEIGTDIDNSSGSLEEMREVQANANDRNKPVFFLGEFKGDDEITFNIAAQYEGIDQPRGKSITVNIQEDSSQSAFIIPSMLANEHLNDMFGETPFDTCAIVDLAMQYNLLCDFTSLIALEPDENHHFMKNPFDESEMTWVEEEDETGVDSLQIDIYPNPFNSHVTVSINLVNSAETSIRIFNIRGQLVKELINSTSPAGHLTLNWNGEDAFNNQVSTGLYFVYIQVRDQQTGKDMIKTNRIMLLR